MKFMNREDYMEIIVLSGGTVALDQMYYEYKGVEYMIVETNAMIQENGAWVSAVIYTNESNILFTRTAIEFYKKFKEIK